MQTWINSDGTERYQIRYEYITCCILHTIQSYAQWYATMPLIESVHTIGWITCLEDCVRSASHDLRQSIVKWTKQAGIIVYRSCTDSISRCTQKDSIRPDSRSVSFIQREEYEALPLSLTREGRKVPWRWIARNYVGREKDAALSRVEILIP